MITTDRVRIVRALWARIEPGAARFADLLYEELFNEEPHLRILFEGPMDEQHTKLAAVISFAVRHLDDPDTLVARLRELGARHARFGVRSHHFEVLGRAWSAALMRMEEVGASEEEVEAWRWFYGYLADAMQKGSWVPA